MKSLEESVVTAMDGSDVKIFPYIPYILQDVWEMGADPQLITLLVRKHLNHYSKRTILDLGCGKGAVSIQLAKELSCTCLGIDAVQAFIHEAHHQACNYHVAHLCTFEVDDIRTRIATLPCFDVIILGSIGPVLGTYLQTLQLLSPCLHDGGKIIIDDGFIADDNNYSHPLVLKRTQLLKQIHEAGMQVIDEIQLSKDDIKESDALLFEQLKKRCHELMKRYPDKKNLFEDYITKQRQETDRLGTDIICSTLVLQKRLEFLRE